MKKIIYACIALCVIGSNVLSHQAPIYAQADITTVKNESELTSALQDSSVTTIVLGANITTDTMIEKHRTVTLDLGGFTLTNKVSNTITNYGNLTIKGNGTVDNISHGKTALSNEMGGTTTLLGGNFTRSQEKGSSATESGGNSYYVLLNHGNMSIYTGVSVNAVGCFSSLIENGWYSASANTAKQNSTLTIYGGTFSGGLYTLKNDDWGKLNIQGGSFTNVASGALLNWNEAEISAGSFTSSNAVINNGAYDAVTAKGILSISGGDFVSEHDANILTFVDDASIAQSVIAISGGTFSDDMQDYVVDNHKSYTTGNKFSVLPLPTSITLSKSNTAILLGNTERLTATFTPYHEYAIVQWSSNNPAIVTVDQKGNLTAKGVGVAKITANVEGKETSCTVTVIKAEEPTYPSIDPSAPVDEIMIGMSNDSSETIKNEVNTIIQDVLNNSSSAVSNDTALKIKEATAQGKTIHASVQAKAIDTTDVSDSVKMLINDLLNKNNTSFLKLAQYLDLNIELVADGTTLGTIDRLSSEVTFTIAIPESFKADGRTYSIIRVHDGVAETLPTTLHDDGTLSFATDAFSTYALVFEDKVMTPDTSKPDDSTDKVETGDTSSILVYFSMLSLSMLGLGTIVLLGKRENKQ